MGARVTHPVTPNLMSRTQGSAVHAQLVLQCTALTDSPFSTSKGKLLQSCGKATLLCALSIATACPFPAQRLSVYLVKGCRRYFAAMEPPVERAELEWQFRLVDEEQLPAHGNAVVGVHCLEAL